MHIRKIAKKIEETLKNRKEKVASYRFYKILQQTLVAMFSIINHKYYHQYVGDGGNNKESVRIERIAESLPRKEVEPEGDE